MSDDDDAPKSGGLMSPLGIAALVAIGVPMVFSMASSSSTTVNGVVVESNYFDPVAVFAGGVGVLLALLLGVVGKGPRLGRWIAALIIMAIGARHVTHGMGIELIPESKQRKPDGTPFAKQAPVVSGCDEDTPEPCAALCEKGDADACDELGVAYAKGEGGLEKDLAKAEPLFIKACDLKDKDGCANAAFAYLMGLTTTLDGPKALELAKQGCALKSSRSCNFAGVILADGKGVEGDRGAANPFFEQACDGGFGGGCANLGYSYRDGKAVEANVDKAIELLGKACDLEEPDACNDLGNVLIDEDRPQEDRDKAMTLYERACALKSPYGCSNLGHRLLQTDPKKALDVLDQACTGGRGRGCEDLGLLLYSGAEGVDKNPAEARRVFAMGCEAGHMNSCTNEGIMLMDGEGGPVDLDEAEEYLKEACDAKEDKACARLKALKQPPGKKPAKKKPGKKK